MFSGHCEAAAHGAPSACDSRYEPNQSPRERGSLFSKSPTLDTSAMLQWKSYTSKNIWAAQNGLGGETDRHTKVDVNGGRVI